MSGPHKKGGHDEGGGGHAPAWIVSFADMVILLMSFFVLLLCQGQQKHSVDEDLLRVLASVKVGFGYTPKANSTDPLDMAVLQILAQKKKTPPGHSAPRWKSPAVKGSSQKERENWVKSQSPIGKPFYFDKGSARITNVSRENLAEIAEITAGHWRRIVIQGHCSDEEALHDRLGGDDLAFRRAMAVKDVLVSQGISAWRLCPVVCGAHESPKTLKSQDRQIVIVTLGSYYLPTEHDVIDDGRVPKVDAPDPAAASGHGGH